MRFFVLAMILLFAVPAMLFAAGGHDALSCTGCHSIHNSKGDIIFEVAPNKESLNPRTGKPYAGVTALCLGCHETTGGMGIAPISSKKSHPYGLKPNPKVAGVPDSLLRNGEFGCEGCHDPHPSNTNHKYLRVNTAKGSRMQDFCSLCHSSKSGSKTQPSKVFSSMDENAQVPEKPAPAPSAAPTRK